MIDNFKPVRRPDRTARKSLARLEVTVQDPVQDSPFVTPEEAAAQDETTVPLPQTLKESDTKKSTQKPKRRRFLPNWSRKQWLLAGAVLLIVLNAAVAAFVMSRRVPPDDGWRPNVGTYQPPEPTTVPSRLTGVEISKELSNLPTTAVMIENSPDARPQSGLKEAGIVFEAIAEGGITRFVALYLESQPKHIGPVRSVRTYFIDLFAPFDAPIAHVGGSAEALAQIRNQGIRDLDQMHNAGAYHRRNHRYAPHNMYTSRAALLDLQRQKGFSKSTFTSLPRKKEKKAKTPAAASIDIQLSSALYNIHYDYDQETNAYMRVMGGKPHTDEQSGTQLRPKVVVALVVPHSHNGIYSVYQINGTGKVFIFQDGIITEGTWRKKGRTSQLQLVNASGKPIALNPGQTWITLAGRADMVSFK